jgi:hypothetical protein
MSFPHRAKKSQNIRGGHSQGAAFRFRIRGWGARLSGIEFPSLTAGEDNMKIQSIMLLVVCAIALGGCETVNKTWHDVFGLNDTPTRTVAH